MEFPKRKLDRADKIQLALAYFVRFSVAAAAVGTAVEGRWLLLFTSLLILALTYLPVAIERRYRLFLPIEVELVIVVFIYSALFLGEIRGYYTKFWWWDLMLHTGSGVAFGFAGFLVLYVLYRKNMLSTSPLWIAVFSFCFAVAIGAMWEIFEFSMDQVFGLNMQKSGLPDTMGDLIVDSVGALATALIGYYYLKGKKEGLINRIITKFAAENPSLFKEQGL